MSRSATPSGSPEAGARPSIGSVGNSYDNALAESIIGLFKKRTASAPPSSTLGLQDPRGHDLVSPARNSL